MSLLPALDNPDLIRLLPLGGLGEIGRNLMVLESRGKLLIIDCGLMFPDAHMTGVDLILPDIAPILHRREDITAVVLTHGHEDHIGALPYLMEQLGHPPVYASRLTLAMLAGRLKERGIYRASDLHRVDEHSSVEVGPFTLEFFCVAHSIPDALGLAIRTPAGLVIHSGDFKLDPAPVDGRRTDLGRLARYGDEGVLLLMADSTNVEQQGHTASESSVGPHIEAILHRCAGRVIATTFSSNLHRIQQLMDAARGSGRAIALSGRSLETNVAIARSLGILKVPDEALISMKRAKDLPYEHLFVLTTGSQGEPQSSLMRMARAEHNDLELGAGDSVILSSKMIPGNEKAVYSLVNNLLRSGAEVFFEKNAPVHVSGHASREELRTLLQLVRPHYFVPVHGEFRHLHLHSQLGQEMGVPPSNTAVLTNGEALRISANGLNREETLPLATIRVCGRGVGDIGEAEVKARSQMAHYGLLLVLLKLDEQGRPVGRPRLISRGLCGQEQGQAWIAEATQLLCDHLEELPPEIFSSTQLLEDELKRPLKRYFNRKHDRRPLILPLLSRGDELPATLEYKD